MQLREKQLIVKKGQVERTQFKRIRYTTGDGNWKASSLPWTNKTLNHVNRYQNGLVWFRREVQHVFQLRCRQQVERSAYYLYSPGIICYSAFSGGNNESGGVRLCSPENTYSCQEQKTFILQSLNQPVSHLPPINHQEGTCSLSQHQGQKSFTWHWTFWLLRTWQLAIPYFTGVSVPFTAWVRSLRLWPEISIFLCAVTYGGPVSKGNWTQWSVDLLGCFVVLIGLGKGNWEFLFPKIVSLKELGNVFTLGKYLHATSLNAWVEAPRKRILSFGVLKMIYNWHVIVVHM